jgi:hypothetical protein
MKHRRQMTLRVLLKADELPIADALMIQVLNRKREVVLFNLEQDILQSSTSPIAY